MQSLTGKVAIVTGGGRGIGRLEALSLAAAGARIVVNDLGGGSDGKGIDRTAANDVVAEIRANGGEAVANSGDVTNFAHGAQMVEQALDQFGRLDILVNNAGIARPKPFLDTTEEDWDLLTAVHLKGHFTVTLPAAKLFAGQNGGRIINTSSEAGLGLAMSGPYGAAKEGITGLTRTLAIELEPFQVTVNQVRPRATDTRLNSIPLEGGGLALMTQWAETLADPEDILTNPARWTSQKLADFVVYLASDAAHEVTGGDFLVGGGNVSPLSKVRPLVKLRWDDPDSHRQLIETMQKDRQHWTYPANY